jgi:surfactin synthase thioesterase subunit
MGAVVAFETARLLESGGTDLLRLFVSGRGAPALGTFDKDLDAWDDDQIIAELVGLGGTGQAQLAEAEVMQMMLPPLRADYRALRSYRADANASVRCPVTALTGEADLTTPVAHAAAWDHHTMSEFDLHTYPGGHFFVADHQDAVVSLLSDHVQEDVAWTRSFL